MNPGDASAFAICRHPRVVAPADQGPAAPGRAGAGGVGAPVFGYGGSNVADHHGARI